MEKEKLNIILTTKGGAEFAVTVPADACTKDQLIDAANAWKAKLNAKHAGTDYEVTDFRYASDTEVANFTPLPDELIAEE